ncbi:hypothetical protein ACVMIH_002380 [Bradyrhizobium sp. USDA 4503]
MAKKKKLADLHPKNEYMCTRGEDSCLLWQWDDADNWYTKFVGTCDCSECHGFLEANKHAVALAGALENAKKG